MDNQTHKYISKLIEFAEKKYTIPNQNPDGNYIMKSAIATSNKHNILNADQHQHMINIITEKYDLDDKTWNIIF
jgi:hypothetical protein